MIIIIIVKSICALSCLVCHIGTQTEDQQYESMPSQETETALEHTLSPVSATNLLSPTNFTSPHRVTIPITAATSLHDTSGSITRTVTSLHSTIPITATSLHTSGSTTETVTSLHNTSGSLLMTAPQTPEDTRQLIQSLRARARSTKELLHKTGHAHCHEDSI